MEKILSIVVPTYNMEALLPRCLDSFILQKDLMDKMEVLVVNDGSKDKSLEIALKYAQEYPNTYKVIDKSNGNYGSCINTALKVATGKYFRICDADDCYENSNLSQYLDFLISTNTDIVFTPYSTYNGEDLVSTFDVPDGFNNGTYTLDELKWNSSELSKFRAMHTMTVKKEILVSHNYHQTEGISYTDTQFVFYSCLYAQTCTFFNSVIYLYFLGRDGQTMSQAAMVKSYMHFYENANKMIDDYIKVESQLSENRAKLLEMSYKNCLYFFATNVLYNIPYQKDKIDLLKELLNKIELSSWNFQTEAVLLGDLSYRLWRKYHIPAFIVKMFFGNKK